MNKIKEGDNFLCIKTCRQEFGNEILFVKDEIYTSEKDGCITNELLEKDNVWENIEYFNEYFKRLNMNNKIKLVSGKEVEIGSLVYWVDKKDLIIRSYEISKGTVLIEDEDCSEVFATFEEAKEWLEKYKLELDLKDLLKDSKEYDYINPNHYKNMSKEVIDMMIDIWGVENVTIYCEITSFKYRMRLGLKPDQPIERDLEKAKWYENKAKELRTKI